VGEAVSRNLRREKKRKKKGKREKVKKIEMNHVVLEARKEFVM